MNAVTGATAVTDTLDATGATRLVFGAGSLCTVADIVAEYRAERVLLIGSDAIVRHTGIERFLPAGTRRFTGFLPNPRLDQVLDGLAATALDPPDLVIGVGGGSAMDTAKLVRALPPGDDARRVVLHGASELLREAAPPLVLVPTVSGSGSEVTRFATVYSEGRKYSVDDPRVLATASVVDPDLAATCRPTAVFSAVLDAIAHSVESYWSLRSTAGSRALAGEALAALRQVVAAGGRRTLDTADRARVAQAAIKAGQAIDVTRTTAAHAFAYPTTARFGVPHGLACCLHLIWLLDHVNARARAESVDPRGPQFVGARVEEIAHLLGARDPEQSAGVLEGLVAACGFATRLGAHAIAAPDIAGLVDAGLGSARAGNLPVRLSPNTAAAALRTRL